MHTFYLSASTLESEPLLYVLASDTIASVRQHIHLYSGLAWSGPDQYTFDLQAYDVCGNFIAHLEDGRLADYGIHSFVHIELH